MRTKENTDLLLKRSLQAIKTLQEQLQKSKQQEEPIAVTGIGCRFPGGCSTPEAFWELLIAGRDGTGPVPPGRWDPEAYYDPDPEVSGKMYVRRAGFLQEDIGEFDARFFGISPREAMEMDPQQRLLLEVCWEALERAGATTRQLRGSNTGVFVGITSSDYAGLPRSLENVDPYTITGSVPNIASGRIANNFGFHGPAYSIDTACSSSLVAVHLACQSLKKGECDLALAGGVGALLTPHPFILLCKMNALSKDGKCKTFDANADGYARAEGCGMIVLKRLSAAQQDRDPVLAIIKGSAVNHDGASSGLTVPNGQAQTQLIRTALDQAGVSPADIGFLETHGTGTILGDPVEVQAIADAFAGKITRSNPLRLGAVKSNIGHLEAAAGIAGLIKVILSLQHKTIPPNLHFKNLNPRIHLEKIPAVVPTTPTPWNPDGKPRLAGISSFGFSGTNAHLVVAEAPAVQETPVKSPAADPPLHILALSAKNDSALDRMIVQYKEYLEQQTHTDTTLAEICSTANACRAHFPLRATFIAGDKEQMIEQLTTAPDAHGKVNESVKPLLAFVFNASVEDPGGSFEKPPPGFHGPPQNFLPGAGESSRLGLEGDEDSEPTSIGSLRRRAPGPPQNFLLGDVGQVGKVLYGSQLFFRQAFDACAALFESYTGHSPVQALRETGPGTDRGVAVAGLFCFQYALAQLWNRWGISPTAAAGEGVGQYIAAYTAGIMDLDTAVKLAARYAGLLQKESEITAKLLPPTLRFVSLAEGDTAGKTGVTDISYWLNRPPWSPSHPGEGESSLPGIQSLLKQGYRYFLEIGTGSGTLGAATEELSRAKAHALPPLPPQNPWETLVKNVSRLYCLGLNIDWQGFAGPGRHSKTILPTYPFQRKRFWLESPPGTPMEKKEPDKKFWEVSEGAGSPNLLKFARRAPKLTPITNTNTPYKRVLTNSPGIEPTVNNDKKKDTHQPMEEEINAGKTPKEKIEETLDTNRNKKSEVNMEKNGHIEAASPQGNSGRGKPGNGVENHDPLEGKLIHSPLEDKQFEYCLDTVVFPDLKDNQNVLHVGYYLEILSRLTGKVLGPGPFKVKEMQYRLVLYFEADTARTLMVTMGQKDEAGVSKFRFFSRSNEKESWSLHAQGSVQLKTAVDVHRITEEKREKIRERCTNQYTGPEFQQKIEQGFGPLGDSVKWADHVWYRDGELLARLRTPSEQENSRTYGLKLHPGILDTCAQLFLLAGAKHLGPDDLFMVVKLEEFIAENRDSHEPLWFHLQVEDELAPEGNMRGQYTLFDNEGNVVAQARGKEVKIVGKEKRAEMKRAFGKEPVLAQEKEYSEVLGMVICASLPEEQKSILQDYLRQIIASILRMLVSEVDANDQLMSLGIDSLIGVELKKTIDRDLQMDIPLQLIYESPTIEQLAETLLRMLPGDSQDYAQVFFTEEVKMDADAWLAFRNVNPQAKVRLFCLPYGVRGASLYRDWQEKLPDFIEVCPIQLPGKENRIREKPIDNLPELVECMEKALAPLLDLPFVIYGHSGGAFTAYRLAYHLWKKPLPQLKHLLVGGFTAPNIWPNPVVIFTTAAFKHGGFDVLPTKEQLDQVSPEKRREIWDYYGVLFEDNVMPDEAKRAVEPATLDEYSLVSSYVPDKDEPPLDIPITGFHGKLDKVVSEIEMRCWKPLTTNVFKLHVLPGTHLFLHADESQQELLKLIKEEIENYT